MPEAPSRPGTSSLACPDPLVSLGPLLRGWLPRQRWFAGKGRPVTGFSPVSATQLRAPGPAGAPGLLHLLVRAEQPPPGGTDCYQLLLGVRESLPSRLAPALIGRAGTGPLAGRTVYDALHDPEAADALLTALRERARIGTLRFERAPDADIPDALAPRLLAGEQSNSSVVYGDTLILKLFRRVVPGFNPDLELPHALARTGCPRVPAPAAWMLAAAGSSALPDPAGGQDTPAADAAADGRDVLVLGVLQPFLRGAADGWELALADLAAGGDFAPEARALGRATAEVHTALARALPTVALGRAAVEELAAGMTRRLTAAVQAVPELRPHAPGLRAAFDALAALAADGAVMAAQRVHGDLHLGQCLRAPSGQWSLIDFEGEPARPLAERRTPQPVVRDIAGMLRSFDYAARSHRPWAPRWADRCRAAYCAGYAEVSGRDPRGEAVVLRAHEADKAVYEVMYEARHRPDWLPVPLAAIHRLAAPGPA